MRAGQHMQGEFTMRPLNAASHKPLTSQLLSPWVCPLEGRQCRVLRHQAVPAALQQVEAGAISAHSRERAATYNVIQDTECHTHMAVAAAAAAAAAS
jgi:hypothetical protein